MRIPLDYYRILGVPIQATLEQIGQAYNDRLQQLPRHPYSNAAIACRKQLLTAAHAVLADPEQRRPYDENFLAHTYLPVSLPPTSTSDRSKPESSGIEIESAQLTGALLLLQELGEYELVLNLGRPALEQPPQERSTPADPDLVLSIGLADLELGREQWQQGQYEKAAHSLQAGLAVLSPQGLFTEVQREIQADLYKLRPYRILELLALPDDQPEQRQRGLTLLQEMLSKRGGIDGTGNDQSGLSIDDFLRFIQQLRSYLTVAEQQEIFEAEAQRPSAVAIYLAVYALIGRGFAEKQPALIRRAKAMLQRLNTRQDVNLELAVCTLLLGQTEEANLALEHSQDYEAIAFIREYSVDSPDLIPGLYLYTERWLRDEVYPYFRDLAAEEISLRDYFSDEQIQNYLDELAPAPDAPETRAAVPALDPLLVGATPSAPNSAEQRSPAIATAPPRSPALDRSWEFSPINSSTGATMATGASTLSPLTTSASRPLSRSGGTSTLEAPPPPANRSLPLDPGRSRQASGPPDPTLGQRSPTPPTSKPSPRRTPSRSTAAPPARGSRKFQQPGSRSRRSWRFVGLVVVGLVGLGAVAAIARHLSQNQTSTSEPPPTLAGAEVQPLIYLERPPVPIPSVPATIAEPPPGVSPTTPVSPQPEPLGNKSGPGEPRPTPPPLSETAARDVIQTWQEVKAAAMGQNHQMNRLSEILVGPALGRWQESAQESQAQKSYWQYSLSSLKIEALKPLGADQVSVRATLEETAKHYFQGQFQADSSYTNDRYQVEYTLVRQAEGWRIREMQVLR